TKTVSGNGNYTSDPFTPTTFGTYNWIASYTGDVNNNTAAGACGAANESVFVDQAPSLQWSSATYSVNENGGSVTLTITRSGHTYTYRHSNSYTYPGPGVEHLHPLASRRRRQGHDRRLHHHREREQAGGVARNGTVAHRLEHSSSSSAG